MRYTAISETIRMLEKEKLDIRTITMGISLLDCFAGDTKETAGKIYDKIYRLSSNLVKTGEEIASEYGIPIINKRISVTPLALAARKTAEEYIVLAGALDKAAKEVWRQFYRRIQAPLCKRA